MVSEIIGVNSGLLFGSYYYGENLGISVFGVPLVIGLNWVVLTISCGNVSYYIFSKNKIFSILLGSFLMLFLDVIMEQEKKVNNAMEEAGATMVKEEHPLLENGETGEKKVQSMENRRK